ncbi:hypothetical protein VKT23_006840 [Stygiomarasmius scandens]|uniref:PEP-CTERM sorting domain-containing protein n=1 Tax=Marasmiellus scandens TaxID=2682957 RepID=A0ABR1JKZ7_9AGAR
MFATWTAVRNRRGLDSKVPAASLNAEHFHVGQVTDKLCQSLSCRSKTTGVDGFVVNLPTRKNYSSLIAVTPPFPGPESIYFQWYNFGSKLDPTPVPVEPTGSAVAVICVAVFGIATDRKKSVL